MDVFEAIKERRSCRAFLSEPINEETVYQILEAAVWAPSPLNMQPWRFRVITNQNLKVKIHKEAERCREWALKESGWKWLDGYNTDFLTSAPVIIAVTGDPQKTGVDMFMQDGGVGYQHACAAAIQNMHLAACSLGLGTLWFTFFDKKVIKEILDIGEEESVIALICLGKSAGKQPPIPRKDVKEKILYMR